MVSQGRHGTVYENTHIPFRRGPRPRPTVPILVPILESRRVISKAGSDPTRLLERVDSHISKQPKVSGESAQV
jgi:hypothetical protein